MHYSQGSGRWQIQAVQVGGMTDRSISHPARTEGSVCILVRKLSLRADDSTTSPDSQLKYEILCLNANKQQVC